MDTTNQKGPVIVVVGEATSVETRFQWKNEKAADFILRNAIVQSGLSLTDVLLRTCATYSPEEAKIASCVVSVGFSATSTVLQKALKIDDAHCYVYDAHGVPCVVALHHVTIHQEPTRQHWLVHAFRKAKAIRDGRELSPTPTLHLAPTIEQVEDFLRFAQAAPAVSLDIEKPKLGGEISCFSVATTDREAMSVPLMGQHKVAYWSPEDEARVWRALALLLACPNEKIFQNYIFDTMIFRFNGMETKGPIWCTMATANLLNPRLEKGLSDLGRLYCYNEPWKGKQDWNLGGDMNDLWRYNALDALRTIQIAECQRKELDQRQLRGFYDRFIAPMYHPVLDTCCRGVRCDLDKLQRAQGTLQESLGPLLDSLKKIAAPVLAPKEVKKKLRDKENDKKGPDGKVIEKAYKEVITETPQEFNPNSNLQVKQVLKALGYKLPSRGGKESTDRGALLKLHRKLPCDFLSQLIRWMPLSKILSSYANIELDSDSRIRFSYAIGGTKSGRFSSSRTPWGTGLNVQTLPRPSKEIPVNIRSCIIPDPGMKLLQVDLSQAELRVVAWLSGDETLIGLLERGEDLHQYVADTIAKVVGRPVPRPLGKMLNHACVTGDHEVLTPYGWVNIEDGPNTIAVWDAKTKEICFTNQLKKHCYQSDKLIRMYGNRFDILATSNHALPNETSQKNINRIELSDLVNKKSGRIPCAGYYKQGNQLDELQTRLLVAIQADGCFVANKTVFHFRKERKVIRIKHILRNLGIGCIESKACNGTTYIRFSTPRWVKDWLPQKELNWKILFNCNPEHIIDECVYWDGHQGKHGVRSYCSMQYINAEIVQAAAHLCGQQAHISGDHGELYKVNIAHRSNIRRECCESYDVSASREPTTVYCYTTPTGYFLMRRHGHIYVSGNSNYGMGAERFSDACLEDAGITVTVKESAELLTVRRKTFPGVSSWQARVEDEVRRTRRLTSPHGRVTLFYGPIDDATIRDALSFVPQATVADITNQAWVALSALPTYNKAFNVLQQGHDSLLLQVQEDHISTLIGALDTIFASLALPVHGRMLCIPHDIALGDDWGSLKDIKK